MNQSDDLFPAFFCVPDITGFTRLIATADIEFSKEIIPGLLRRLIDANQLRMNIGEIEGDAIFFYRTGRLPDSNRVMKQCLSFFKVFKLYIRQFRNTHPEYFDKHLAGDILGLKIIIHYGYASTASIKGRTKLIGKDVIITHRLLKNNVPATEYILFSGDYLKRISGKNYLSLFRDKTLIPLTETYEHIGEVSYSYLGLTEFSAEIFLDD